MKQRSRLHLGEVAIEVGAFESPSSKVANFTYCYVVNYSFVITSFGVPNGSSLLSKPPTTDELNEFIPHEIAIISEPSVAKHQGEATGLFNCWGKAFIRYL